MKPFTFISALCLLTFLFATTTYAQISPASEPEYKEAAFVVEDFDFVISPNPGVGLVEVTLNQDLTIEAELKVFAEDGMMVLHGCLLPGQCAARMDLTNLPAGNYTFLLEVGYESIAHTFILNGDQPKFR